MLDLPGHVWCSYLETCKAHVLISLRARASEAWSCLMLTWPRCRPLCRSRFQPSATTVQYRDASGRVRFKGAGKALKNTQVYPPKFGRHAPRQQTMSVCAGLHQVCNLFAAAEVPDRKLDVDWPEVGRGGGLSAGEAEPAPGEEAPLEHRWVLEVPLFLIRGRDRGIPWSLGTGVGKASETSGSLY